MCMVAGGRNLFTTTITIGGSGPYGYGRDTILAGTIGNITGATFTDASGISRTITVIIDGAGDLILALNGTSVPDTDATFHHIFVNGVYYARSARSTYSSDTGPDDDSAWKWANGATNSIGTSGSATLEIWA